MSEWINHIDKILPENSLCCLSCYMNDNNNNPDGLCKNMKDVYEVFDENLKLLIEIIDITNMQGCFRISADLSIFSALADFSDGVLICEVMDSIFLDIGTSIDEYEVEIDDSKQVVSEVRKGLKLILSCYRDDPNTVYSTLKTMHLASGKFSLRSRKETKRKSEEE